MKWHLFLSLGGPARAIAGLQPIGEPQWNDGVVCYTYLSTYLVAIAAETAEPDFPTLPSFPTTRGIVPPYFSNRSTLVPPSVVTEASEIKEIPTTIIDFTTSNFAIQTEDQEDPGTTATDSDSLFLPTSVTSAEASPTSSEAASGQAVIFFISPQVGEEKRDIVKRAPGGFIGSDNTNVDICTNADTFRLGDGQLFDLQDPIYYNGESYKKFRSQGAPPADSVTREFSNVAGSLVFSNRALPNSNAGFCQVEEGGQVYITFTSSPPSCVPISLRVYAVEQCQDGRIIGLDPAETATTESKQSSSIAETINTASTKTTTFPEDLSSTAISTVVLSQSTDSYSEMTETTQSLDLTESSASSSSDQATTITSYSSPESTLSSLSSSSPLTGTALSFTTSAETPIISVSLSSFLSSYKTAASSESFSSLSTLSSDLISSEDTFSSEPTSTLSMESSTESALTSEVSTTITEESMTATEESMTATEESMTATEESTTATEEPTITTEVLTTTTEDATTTTNEEPTTTTGCNSVDPLTTVALANPTPVFSGDIYRDNDFTSIIVPWDGGLAGTSQSQVFINTNGVITVDSGQTFQNNRGVPTDFLVDRAFLPYWDDLVLDPTKGHTIVYEFSQGNLGTQLTIEFILGKADSPGIYHFEAVFFEESGNSVFFRYYTTPERGSSATIGFQNVATGRSAQVSYNQANSLLDGLAIFLSLDDSNSFLFFGFDNTECGIGQALQFP